MKIFIALVIVSLAAGCTSTNMAEIIKAAAQDKAHVTLKISSFGTIIDYTREMPAESPVK